jgi:hypothetical protein
MKSVWKQNTFLLVSCSDYLQTVKKEAVCSSETTVEFRRNTRRYNPEERMFSI